MTGNGLTSDDTPLNGVTIKLYKDDGDNVRDSGDTLVGDAGHGDHRRRGGLLQLHRPRGREVFCRGNGAGRHRSAPIPLFTDYNTVTLGTGRSVTGINFANVEICDYDDITNISYTIKRGGSTFTVSSLSGNVNQGDMVTVELHGAGRAVRCPALAGELHGARSPSSTLRGPACSSVYEAQTGFFMPGTHSMTVDIPCWNFQIDFVCGAVIDQFWACRQQHLLHAPGPLDQRRQRRLQRRPVRQPLPGATLIVGGSSGQRQHPVQRGERSDQDLGRHQRPGSRPGVVRQRLGPAHHAPGRQRQRRQRHHQSRQRQAI